MILKISHEIFLYSITPRREEERLKGLTWIIMYIEVAKSFTGHVALSKDGCTFCEPPKIIEPTPMVLEPVESVVALSADGFDDKPPYPAKIKENTKILDAIISKSAKKSCIPYEQVKVHPHVSTIKALNQ
jgi:hypothetical protein